MVREQLGNIPLYEAWVGGAAATFFGVPVVVFLGGIAGVDANMFEAEDLEYRMRG